MKTVGDLQKFLARFPSDTKIVKQSFDHQYRPASFSIELAEIEYKEGDPNYIMDMWYYHDKHNMTDENNTVEQVIVID